MKSRLWEINATYDEMVKEHPIGSKFIISGKKTYEVKAHHRGRYVGDYPTLLLERVKPDEKTSVTQEDVDRIIENAEKEVFHAVFGKQCIVVLLLQNGFTVVGESGCVDPDNYDKEIGERIAMQKITEQIWMLEGYKLQNELNL